MPKRESASRTRGQRTMDTCCTQDEKAVSLWQSHTTTGEPLDEEEVARVVAAGLASAEDWEDRGGGLYWHAPTWPEPQR
jgi:hypothetical protein